jgi:hypothetical protein
MCSNNNNILVCVPRLSWNSLSDTELSRIEYWSVSSNLDLHVDYSPHSSNLDLDADISLIYLSSRQWVVATRLFIHYKIWQHICLHAKTTRKAYLSGSQSNKHIKFKDFFSIALQPLPRLGLYIGFVIFLYTYGRTPWMSDQLIAPPLPT